VGIDRTTRIREIETRASLVGAGSFYDREFAERAADDIGKLICILNEMSDELDDANNACADAKKSEEEAGDELAELQKKLDELTGKHSALEEELTGLHERASAQDHVASPTNGAADIKRHVTQERHGAEAGLRLRIFALEAELAELRSRPATPAPPVVVRRQQSKVVDPTMTIDFEALLGAPVRDDTVPPPRKPYPAPRSSPPNRASIPNEYVVLGALTSTPRTVREIAEACKLPVDTCSAVLRPAAEEKRIVRSGQARGTRYATLDTRPA
jgi:hypothetical protein